MLARVGRKELIKERADPETIALVKPGRTVTLNVRGRQGTHPVKLEVGQGIDERKPLLSLFITRESKLEAREWIGGG